MPATSASLQGFFLLQPLTVLMEQVRQAVHAIKQSIFLGCLWLLCLSSLQAIYYSKTRSRHVNKPFIIAVKTNGS